MRSFAVICHDMDREQQREAVLSQLQKGAARRPYEAILTTTAVLGLLRIGAAASGRMLRIEVAGQSKGLGYKMSGEDMQLLQALGHIEHHGKFLEITERGNALVREMLAFAKAWEGGAA